MPYPTPLKRRRPSQDERVDGEGVVLIQVCDGQFRISNQMEYSSLSKQNPSRSPCYATVHKGCLPACSITTTVVIVCTEFRATPHTAANNNNSLNSIVLLSVMGVAVVLAEPYKLKRICIVQLKCFMHEQEGTDWDQEVMGGYYRRRRGLRLCLRKQNESGSHIVSSQYKVWDH